MVIKRFPVGEYFSNSYVVYDNKKAFIVDAGYKSDALEYFVEKNELEIVYVLLTHGHFDHILACEYYREKYNCDIVIGETEAKQILLLNKGFDYDIDNLDISSYCLVNDGDVISVGNMDVKVIATPGHTSGGVCYLLDDNLFSGDTLFNMSIGRTDFYSGNFEEISKSIMKLYKLSEETKVYPGHGFTTKIGYEKTNNPFVRGDS
ncbi:MAG: MBL fold metallo-hydrolase [Clostridia bacterium]|nr:MBL fold metallo-hydrolase [Clostridia bacterium]